MAFRLEDFKKTTRKSSGGSALPASIYPHQMKDKKALARLEVAIRTFDSLVGKKRGEMDAQTMVDFFGDPRLARGVVACLGQFYKYQTPRFGDIVTPTSAARLAQDGLTSPMAVRAHTYAHVNATYDGFLTEAQRAACYAELGAAYAVSAHDWDNLLHLDAENNQVLTRPGAVPCPADMVALYNFHSLDTPLRRASQIVLSGLSVTSGEASDIRALARALGIKAVVSGEGTTVTLSDLEMSSLLQRRAGRLSRCLLHLIQAFATSGVSGHADVQLGARKCRLVLDTAALKTLGMASPRLPIPFRRRFEAADVLHKGLLKLRAQGDANGWRIKRLPEPLVSPTGILLADFLLIHGDQQAYLVFGSASPAEGDAPLVCLPLDRKPLTAAETLARVEEATCNLFALPVTASPPAVPSGVRALCDKAAIHGMVRTADAQRALHLLDESPLIEWVRRAADPRVRYIPGIGLCSQEFVDAIKVTA